MNTKIIADTSVWIEFFRNEASLVSETLKQLLRSGRVALTGMVLAEILQGIRSPREARLVKGHLESLPFAEVPKNIWLQAGEMSAALRKKGLTIPLSDILIASAAVHEEGYEVFPIDPHFQKIPGLALHKPAPASPPRP
ncbi:MAG: PIN domain-containing protein [Desulfobacteraceae bacterium]